MWGQLKDQAGCITRTAARPKLLFPLHRSSRWLSFSVSICMTSFSTVDLSSSGHLDFLQLWNCLSLSLSINPALLKLCYFSSLFRFLFSSGVGATSLPRRWVALNSKHSGGQILSRLRTHSTSHSFRLVPRNHPQSTSPKMAEGGEYHAPNTAANGNGDSVAHQTSRPSDEQPPLEQVESILRSRANTPNPFSRQRTSLDLDDYFVSFFHQKTC